MAGKVGQDGFGPLLAQVVADVFGLPCEAIVDGMAVRVDEDTLYQPDVILRCGARMAWEPPMASSMVRSSRCATLRAHAGAANSCGALSPRPRAIMKRIGCRARCLRMLPHPSMATRDHGVCSCGASLKQSRGATKGYVRIRLSG